jgi:SAM-dependent methyltransferase
VATYDQSYFVKPCRHEGGLVGYGNYEAIDVLDAFWRLALLEILSSKPGSLLDIGPAYGGFLEMASLMGWDASGIDISEDAVKVCRRRGLRVIQGDFLEFTSKERFGVITAWEVLEHVPDVLAFLENVFNLPAEDGIFICFLPDAGNYLTPGSRWRGFETSLEHVSYFSRGALHTLLERVSSRRAILSVGRGPNRSLLGWVRMERGSSQEECRLIELLSGGESASLAEDKSALYALIASKFFKAELAAQLLRKAEAEKDPRIPLPLAESVCALQVGMRDAAVTLLSSSVIPPEWMSYAIRLLRTAYEDIRSDLERISLDLQAMMQEGERPNKKKNSWACKLLQLIASRISPRSRVC